MHPSQPPDAGLPLNPRRLYMSAPTRDVACGTGTRLRLYVENDQLCRHARNGPAERTQSDSRQNATEGA
jgi:hypothetical protein